MEADFEFFLNNYSGLCKRYPNQYVVIKNRSIIGSYENRLDAIDATMLTEPLGTFIVQKCTESSDSLTVTVRRPVCIAG